MPVIQLSTPTQVASTPAPPAQIVFLHDSQSPSAINEQIESALITYAQSHTFEYVAIDSLELISIETPLNALVAIGEIPNLAQLASEHPQSKIISIAGLPVSGPSNLYSLTGNDHQAEIAAFMLGYSAALSTNDWRVGALYLQEEILFANAFLAGVEYFCGACGPVAPPYNNYPQAAGISDTSSWMAPAQELLNQGIRTIYLSPTLEVSEIQQFFVDRSIKSLGTIDPADSILGQWLLTISPNSSSQPVNQMLALLNNLPQEEFQFSIEFSNIDSNEISEARLFHLKEILAEIDLALIAMPSEITP